VLITPAKLNPQAGVLIKTTAQNSRHTSRREFFYDPTYRQIDAPVHTGLLFKSTCPPCSTPLFFMSIPPVMGAYESFVLFFHLLCHYLRAIDGSHFNTTIFYG
jgi:hypothetical protein